MKLISWNVNGIRAIAKKDFFTSLAKLDPDVLCVQETKAAVNQVNEVMSGTEGYQVYSNAAERPGYSGTAVFARKSAETVSYGIGIAEHDREGRVITLEYPQFFLVNVYVPNSGNELKRLEYRQEWDRVFYKYLKGLEAIKPVVTCGDFNVAHKEIDLARPKANYNKSAGFMQEEIDGMDRYTGGGLADTFRHLNPGLSDKYSWWSYRAGARAKNVGWRIDYFLASQALLPKITEAFILSEYMGSDHCPVGILLDI